MHLNTYTYMYTLNVYQPKNEHTYLMIVPTTRTYFSRDNNHLGSAWVIIVIVHTMKNLITTCMS